MAATEQDLQSGEATVPTPVTLTLEELKVLKECRWNSIAYRGFPLGIISFAAAKAVTQAGYFRKYSGLFYTGMISIGFFTGIGSYSETCARKIMALENSALGDKFRAYRKGAGLPIDDRSAIQSGEFEDEFPELSVPTDKPVTEAFDSPLKKRLEVSNNKWDDIRNQSRQAHSSNSNEKGISYDDLRMKNRANQGDYNSLTPEEEAELEKKEQSLSSDMARFNAHTFYTDKPSALDFSKSDESRLSSFSDKHRGNEETESGEKTRKSYTKGIPYKNKYGDDVE